MDMSMSDMTSSTSTMMMDMASSTSTMMMDMTGMTQTTNDMMATMTGMVMSMATSMSGMSSMTMSGMSNMSGTSSMAGMAGMAGMNMSGGSSSTMSSTRMKMSCTMSMLWNWYTKDVCFISDQWKTSTTAKFGGTCVGCFALLLAINWWRRILLQYKIYCAELRREEVGDLIKAGVQINRRNEPFKNNNLDKKNNMFVETMIPFMETWKHDWFWALNKNLTIEVDGKLYIYPSVLEHLLNCIGDTMEWSVHHVIMLLFMYFNGYVFISCMIGAGVGFMLFQYRNINIGKRGDNVSKRCCI